MSEKQLKELEKMSTWLCTTYKVILIPKFHTKKGRKIGTKAVRGMLCWSHYKFRQRLIAKSELFSNCKVIECDESYTSKTCGFCSVTNTKLGGNKVFKCKQPSCHQKYIGSDR
eukprot:Pgem_evm1s13268